MKIIISADPPAVISAGNAPGPSRQAFGKVGIAVTVWAQEFATYVKRVYTDRAFDIAYAWLITDTDPSGIQSYYWSQNFKPGVPFSNGAHYDNPALEAAAVEVDDSKRIGQYD